MMPPVGKSGPLMYFSSVLARAFGLSIRNSAASQSSCGVVRRDRGRHADGDALRAVGQQIGERARQHDRLGLAAVVGRAEIDRVLVDAVEQQPRHLGQPRFGVAHRRRVIAVDVAEVALPVDQRIALREILREPHQRVVDRLVAVRMEFADHVADHARRLLERLAGSSRNCRMA